jgi:3-dehydroquinate dehydratase I
MHSENGRAVYAFNVELTSEGKSEGLINPVGHGNFILKAGFEQLGLVPLYVIEGGNFRGIEAERIDLLFKASEFADSVGIELKAEFRSELISRIDMPAIVSYHNFRGMPRLEDLRSILKEISKTGAAIAKIAVTPATLKDNLTLLELLLESDMPLCAIAMGELGRHLRAISPIYGSALTYCYISEAVAPGQMSLADLRQALKILIPDVSCRK